MSPIVDLQRPRWRKVISDLWESRARTALVVTSIAVGVFAIGTILTAYFVIAEDMSVSYAAANPANIDIITSPFDNELLRTVEKLDGIEEVEGRHNLTLRISQDEGQTWRALSTTAVDDFSKANIFKLRPVLGNASPNDRELLLEVSSLDIVNASVGDVLWVELSDGTIRQMPIAGVVKDESVLATPDATAVGYVSMDTLEWLGKPRTFNRLFARVSGDSNDDGWVTAVSETVEDKLERENRPLFQSYTNLTDEHPMTTTVLAVLSVMIAMGVLMLVLGCSLIANTLNALLSQHKRQIGVMKLIGAQSFQILGMYISLIIAYSLISLALAVPLSAVAGYRFSEFLAAQLSITLQGYRFIPVVFFVQIVIAIFIPLVAGFLPVNSGSKTTVEKAISDAQVEAQSAEGSFFDRLGEQIGWLSRPMLIAFRNTFRRKGRLALTLFTLTMAGAIFIAVFNVQASLNGFTRQIGNMFLADVMIEFERPYRKSQIEEALKPIPGVVDQEGWLAASAELLRPDDTVESAVIFLAPPAGSPFTNPNVHTGRWQQEGDLNTVVIADSILNSYPDLQIGDTLRIKVQGRRAEAWTVIGLFTFPDPGEESLIAYTTYATIEEELNLPDQVTSYRVQTAVQTLDHQKEAAAMVDEQLRSLGFNITSVEAGGATIAEISDTLGILVNFFLIMALLTALVGSIGLAGTMGMNVMERTREIGVMRAIGAVDFEIMKSVVVEGVFIGVVSWLIGSLLSFPISFLLLRLVSTALFSSPMELFFSVKGFIYWLVVVLILATLASILPARNAARLTIREVLAYE